MRKWLLSLVTALMLGLMLAPTQPAGAIPGTGGWLGNCVGEIDVTLTPKTSFTSLAPAVGVSLQGSGMLCVVATTPGGYSGPLSGTITASGSNLTSLTCEAGIVSMGAIFELDSRSDFPQVVNITTELSFNATAATLVMVRLPDLNFAAAAELVPLDPAGLASACASPPGGSITIRYEAVMVYEDPTPPSVSPGG